MRIPLYLVKIEGGVGLSIEASIRVSAEMSCTSHVRCETWMNVQVAAAEWSCRWEEVSLSMREKEEKCV